MDDSESDKNTCFSLPCDYLDEMVLDSEDEEVNGSRVVKITNRTHKEIEKFALDLDSTHREPSLPFGIAKAKVENTCASTEGKCSTGQYFKLKYMTGVFCYLCHFSLYYYQTREIVTNRRIRESQFIMIACSGLREKLRKTIVTVSSLNCMLVMLCSIQHLDLDLERV